MESRTPITKMIAHVSGIDSLSSKTHAILEAVAHIKYKKIETKDELINTLKSCDIFWFRLNHKLTREVLITCRCKYILCAVTGLDHIDLQACEEFNIKVISLKGETDFLKNIRATAEHTIGLMLALLRKSKSAFNHVEKGLWDRTKFQGSELYNKKIGIFGLGRLGTIVAHYASAFGMKVYFYDIEEKEFDSAYVKCKTKEELMSSVDILTIHLPYNDNTHFIVNFDLLNHIERPLYMINTSRGGLVNEEDLLKCIQQKRILGYATDVLYQEPEVHDNILVKSAVNNEAIIITPHIGGNTYESIENTENFIARKFLSILEKY